MSQSALWLWPSSETSYGTLSLFSSRCLWPACVKHRTTVLNSLKEGAKQPGQRTLLSDKMLFAPPFQNLVSHTDLFYLHKIEIKAYM